MWSDDAPQTPLEIEPFLVVQLKPGWRHDPESGVFRRPGESDDDEEVFEPAPELPAETRIEPMIPDLAGKSPDDLSEWELTLARYLHLFPGADADLDELLEAITDWSCVEEVHRPPQIALP
ncbi:MAG: hypothetical protein GY769_14355 [bacterium]|nr:hypothetical protein [bacterium]